MSETFRPTFGRALTVFIGALCGVIAVALVANDGLNGLRAVPWVGLFAVACWATFWRPKVVVDDGGVELVNVLRTIRIPWPAIVDVDTKWALTMVTAYGTFTAWAAPAPGMHAAVRATKKDVRRLPAEVLTPQGIRPGDLPDSESGSAALRIRLRWAALREAGHLDAPRLEHETAPVQWHSTVIITALALIALGVVGFVV